MKAIVSVIILSLLFWGCSDNCKPNATPFKPNFCMDFKDVMALEGIKWVPEDVPIMELVVGDTVIGFIGDDEAEKIVWQTWEVPIDSNDSDYLDKYFEYRPQHIVCPHDIPTSVLSNFYVRDSKTNLFYNCSVKTESGKKTLFIIFEFPDLSEYE
ncbi:hypothetical protein BH09BAC1_BH09BAC1_08130 [soil metagenome]